MADESKAVETARQFREQLVRQEDAALREMSRHWVRMEKDLEAQYMALYTELLSRLSRGEVVPTQEIYNLQRYGDMMAQIMQEIPDYDSEAVRIMTDYQIDSYNLGLESARATIMGTSPSDSIWNVVGKDAAEAAAGFAGNGAPLGALLQHDYGDLGAKVIDSLVSGIALGKGAYETAKDMRDVMGMEYKRSVRIARTEINRAYRIAAADQYAKSGVVEKVLRLCAKTPETCLACLEMDGEECPNGIVDDHPNGRCTSVVVTTGGIYPQWQHGHDWLMEQDEDTQRAIMGDGRFEMWKKDNVSLRDMVEMKPNPVWGGSPTIISEADIRKSLEGLQ